MYRAVHTPEQGWQGEMEPYQCLQIEPAAQVLNYGQSVFEGMKAQRTATGQIVLFRPKDNAARMAEGMSTSCFWSQLVLRPYCDTTLHLVCNLRAMNEDTARISKHFCGRTI